MVKLRPGRSSRSTGQAQPWSRYSVKKPRKNFVRALPRTSLLIFNMGTRSNNYDMVLTIKAKMDVQVRSNALEAARQNANKFLEKQIPGNYSFKVLTYPHNVIREKRFAVGAGADRLSQGMSMTFGKPASVAARIRKGQTVFELRTMAANRNVAKIAMKRASGKLSGSYSINVTELGAPAAKASTVEVTEDAAAA